MKKILILVLSVVFLLFLCSCENEKLPAEKEPDNSKAGVKWIYSNSLFNPAVSILEVDGKKFVIVSNDKSIAIQEVLQ